jgi:thiol-disulfide isomerase/thioredoxin
MFFGVDLRKTLKELVKRTVSVKDYVMHMDEPFRDRFLKRMKAYSLKEDIVEELKKRVDEIFVVVFSAEWCKDCAANVPVLALLANKTGVKVRVFGGLKKDLLNPNETWRIPPSPPELREFKVERTPHIVVFHINGLQLGKIVEKSAPNKTLEEEILQLVKQ